MSLLKRIILFYIKQNAIKCVYIALFSHFEEDEQFRHFSCLREI